MDTKLIELKKTLGQNRVRINEPMSLHTTFRIGGPAEYYIDVDKLGDLIKSVRMARKLSLPVFVFGGGSNIIVAGGGIKGLVIKNNCRRFEVMKRKDHTKNHKGRVAVFAESGAIMNQLVRYTVDQGLSGLEYQLGLPGTVGGGIYMNSNFPKKGAFIGDYLYKAKLLTKDGVIKHVDRSYFQFAYDKSVLQETREIVLSVTFALIPADRKILSKQAMEAFNYRSSTQAKNASGCTYRNIAVAKTHPVLTPKQIASASNLIEKAGLKGKRIGDAMVSSLHANFILNMGRAKAEDVVALVDLMKSEVLKKFGVNLHLEVRSIGF